MVGFFKFINFEGEQKIAHLLLFCIPVVLSIFITCSTLRKLNSNKKTNNLEKFIVKIFPKNLEEFLSKDINNSIFVKSDVKTIDIEKAYEFMLNKYNNFKFSRLDIFDIKKYAEPLLLLEKKENTEFNFNNNLVMIHIKEEDIGYDRTYKGCLIIYNGGKKKVSLFKEHPKLKETDHRAIGGFLILMIYIFCKIGAGVGLGS